MVRGRRAPVEYEADKFAACFLMPEAVMREDLQWDFPRRSVCNLRRTAFAIGANNATQLLDKCPSIRSLSLRLARADIFAGRPVNSIATIFGVSNGAMAIRIEELQMIDMNYFPKPATDD